MLAIALHMAGYVTSFSARTLNVVNDSTRLLAYLQSVRLAQYANILRRLGGRHVQRRSVLETNHSKQLTIQANTTRGAPFLTPTVTTNLNNTSNALQIVIRRPRHRRLRLWRSRRHTSYLTP